MLAYRSIGTQREFASRLGLVRIGADCQLVIANKTVASSADAHAWADANMTGRERDDLKRGTKKPTNT